LAASSNRVVRVSNKIFPDSAASEIQTFRPGDDVVRAVSPREGRDPGRVEPGTGLGHTEADMQVAVDDPWQVLLLELVRAVHDHRMHPEDRQVHRARGVYAAAGSRDLFQQDGCFGDSEAVTAVLHRRRYSEPAGLREGVVELVRELVRRIFLEPVLIVEAGRELRDRSANRGLIFGRFKVHAVPLPGAALLEVVPSGRRGPDDRVDRTVYRRADGLHRVWVLRGGQIARVGAHCGCPQCAPDDLGRPRLRQDVDPDDTGRREGSAQLLRDKVAELGLALSQPELFIAH
jgi:hypothetical protein